MITWVLYLFIGIVIGGMAGFYFAKLDDFSKKQKQELEEKLQQSERELVEYKDQVTAHFKETAHLINNMTESYQKVHEHLANGSVELCNNAIEVNKLTISTNTLLSTSQNREVSSVDEVNNLAESEAPKTSTIGNNNNKPEEVDAAKVPGSDDPEPVAAEHHASTTPEIENSPEGTSTTAQSDEEPQVASASTIPDNPVIETMAVADEEDTSTNKEDSETKNPIPGSRMVH